MHPASHRQAGQVAIASNIESLVSRQSTRRSGCKGPGSQWQPHVVGGLGNVNMGWLPITVPGRISGYFNDRTMSPRRDSSALSLSTRSLRNDAGQPASCSGRNRRRVASALRLVLYALQQAASASSSCCNSVLLACVVHVGKGKKRQRYNERKGKGCGSTQQD